MPEVARKESHKQTPNSMEVVMHRRELVARLRIRGLTMREIVAALARPGENQLLNPQSREPFTLSTIKDDCHWLDRQWLASISGSLEEQKALVRQELKEVKRAGWSAKDMNVVLKALQQERALLGLDAPAQINISVIRQRAREIADRLGISADALLAEAKMAVVEAAMEE